MAPSEDQSGGRSGRKAGYLKPLAAAGALLAVLAVAYMACPPPPPLTVVEPNPITFSKEVPSNVKLASTDSVGGEISAIASRELGLVASQLTDMKTRNFGGMNVFTFGVTIGGIPLAGARVVARVDDATSVVSTIEGYNVVTEGANSREASVSPDRAVALALRRSSAITGIAERRLSHTDPTQILVPGSTATEAPRLCWDITVSLIDETIHHSYRYFITATQPALLLREQNLVQSDRQGHVTSMRWARTPLGATLPFGVPRALIKQSTKALVSADNDGGFRLADAIAGTISTSFESEYVRILLPSQTSTVDSASHVISTGGDILLRLGSVAPGRITSSGSNEELSVAQASAYYWAEQAHEFFGQRLDRTDLRPVRLTVNDRYSDCGGHHFGRGEIRMFAATSGCINGAYADWVIHEYGHAVDEVVRGYFEDDLSEGFADSIAILMTGSSCVGQDWNGPKTCARESDDTKLQVDRRARWPPLSDEKHERGRILSSVVWDLYQALSTTIGPAMAVREIKEMLLEAISKEPNSIKAAVGHMAGFRNSRHRGRVEEAAAKRKLIDLRISAPPDEQSRGGAGTPPPSVPSPSTAPASSPSVVEASVATPPDKPLRPLLSKASSHLVIFAEPGASLWSISRKAYGEGRHWCELLDREGHAIPSDIVPVPDRIRAGSTILGPRVAVRVRKCAALTTRS